MSECLIDKAVERIKKKRERERERDVKWVFERVKRTRTRRDKEVKR